MSAIDKDRVGRRAGAGVDDRHACPFRSEVAIAEGKKGDENRAEIASALGENVFVPGRVLAIAPPAQKSRIDERVQPPGQHVGRDRQAPLKFFEPGHAPERVPQNEDAPPLPNPVEATGDRAIHGVETGSLHLAYIDE